VSGIYADLSVGCAADFSERNDVNEGRRDQQRGLAMHREQNARTENRADQQINHNRQKQFHARNTNEFGAMRKQMPQAYSYTVNVTFFPAWDLGNGFRDALDACCFSAGVVYFNYASVEEDPVLRHFESLRHSGQESLDDRLDFAAQYAFVRTAKPGVAQKGRAARENLLVRRLHMSVSADDGGHPSIQHSREGDLFGGGFGVKVHEYDFRLLTKPINFLLHEEEGVFQRRHERPALEVHHRHEWQRIL
jgi:hypothetical protein